MTRILLSVALILPVASTAFAQTQANTGQIEGMVWDPSQGAVPGAAVTIRNTETNQVRTLATDGKGFYRASLLQIGSYEITIESPHLAVYQRRGIRLATGEILTVNARMQLAGLQQEVTVEASANIVETSRTSLSRAVNEIDVEALPTSRAAS